MAKANSSPPRRAIISLARSDSYYGGSSNHKAYVDSVEFRISKSVDSAYTDFENGTGQACYADLVWDE